MSFDPSQYDGVVCTLDQLQQSNQPDAPIHCLTRGQSMGLTVNTVAAFASLMAVLVTFILIARNYLRHVWSPPPAPWRLIQSPMDLYMLSLFVSNFVQAIGTVLDVKWLHDGILENGSYCTAQGTIQQLGETSVAMCTCAIALHTFVAMWWGKGVRSLRTAISVVTFIWLFVILFVGIGAGIHRNGNYETPTPYWCWIGPHYEKEKITGEYMWFWLTLATSAVTYTALYFWSRGNITVHPDKWWSFRIHRVRNIEDKEVSRGFLLMLVYPITYSIIVLPVSVVRWIAFVQESKGNDNGISSQATLVANFIFELSGLLDVILFFWIRGGLLLFVRRETATEVGRAPSPSPSSTPVPSEKGHPRIESDTTMRDLELGGANGNGDHCAPSGGRLPGDGDDGWDFPQMDEPNPIRQSMIHDGSDITSGHLD